MASVRTRKRSRPRRRQVLHKPTGHFHTRVQEVGPQHFGIVCVDPHKARSRWMLADFFGSVLIPPSSMDHNSADFGEAIDQVRQAIHTHQLGDILVVIERTGRLHHPVRGAFSAAGFECRIVHPFATKQFRQPANPGNKTDDTDLAAIHAAAIQGFALLEAELDEQWKTFQLLARHRRDLVQKNSKLCCQIREHVEAAFPGLAACFGKFWDSAVATHLLHHFAAPADIHAAGVKGLRRNLQQAGVRFQTRTLETVLDWAEKATRPDVASAEHLRIALVLDDDRTRKTQEIMGCERDLAYHLCRTPYVLLLSFPGINVVSASDFAAEMGPIEHYANHRHITGRAGLYPSRYQSDQTDHANGPLVRCGNRRLRAVLLCIADNLVGCNQHFNVLLHSWRSAGCDPRHTRVKVASRFCRMAFHMVAGRQVFRHRAVQGRHYIIDKLLAFHREHGTDMPTVLRDVQEALNHVPKKEHRAEAKPLQDELQKIREGGRRGPQPLGDILPIILAKLGVHEVKSNESGECDLH